MATMREYIQLKKGGEHYLLNETERKVLLVLMKASPNVVPHITMQAQTGLLRRTIKKMVMNIRPVITMEGGAIECVNNHGYRIFNVSRFE